ncbi:hypothetical protein P154DRAFT_558658 [Amniculicola lignicola CBS 123094]|uniref:Uncharacterized protein n=1 Tax=Amniculicola lignicola CBS 123094 TaxID=1392246 RepID=A0A6A5X3C2_9PLEO|nr:hypothetical protein P154DRAFT_558658 [Amniculicola lignicola CBS 123094]
MARCGRQRKSKGINAPNVASSTRTTKGQTYHVRTVPTAVVRQDPSCIPSPSTSASPSPATSSLDTYLKFGLALDSDSDSDVYLESDTDTELDTDTKPGARDLQDFQDADDSGDSDRHLDKELDAESDNKGEALMSIITSLRNQGPARLRYTD